MEGDVKVYVLVYWRLLAKGYLSSENSASACIALYIHLCPMPPSTP